MSKLYLALNCKFSDEEKDACLPVIDKLFELINTTRKSGLLALEKLQPQEGSFFTKTAMQLVLDAHPPAMIEEVLQNLILADGYSGAQLLERLLITEAFLCISVGMNPRVMRTKLFSMLGERYMEKYDV